MAPDILSPLGLDDFFSQWYEQQPLHISRADTDWFSTLVTLADIETLLSTQVLTFPDVQLARANDPLPVADYTGENHQISAMRLLQGHTQGGTIIISRAHRYFAPLAGLTRSVQGQLGMQCQANLYLTPPRAQGFKSHYDLSLIHI